MVPEKSYQGGEIRSLSHGHIGQEIDAKIDGNLLLGQILQEIEIIAFSKSSSYPRHELILVIQLLKMELKLFFGINESSSVHFLSFPQIKEAPTCFQAGASWFKREFVTSGCLF